MLLQNLNYNITF